MREITCSNPLRPVLRQCSTSVASMVLMETPAVLLVCLNGSSRSDTLRAVLPARPSPSKTRKARRAESIFSVSRSPAHVR